MPALYLIPANPLMTLSELKIGDGRVPRPSPSDVSCQTRTRNAAGADATDSVVERAIRITRLVAAEADSARAAIRAAIPARTGRVT